jgi:hypothetical protein
MNKSELETLKLFANEYQNYFNMTRFERNGLEIKLIATYRTLLNRREEQRNLEYDAFLNENQIKQSFKKQIRGTH